MLPCHRVHFRRLVFPWTDLSMGNCSYLDTCRHMKTCRYVHYELDDDLSSGDPAAALGINTPGARPGAPPAKPRPSVPAYLAVHAPPRLHRPASAYCYIFYCDCCGCSASQQ